MMAHRQHVQESHLQHRDNFHSCVYLCWIPKRSHVCHNPQLKLYWVRKKYKKQYKFIQDSGRMLFCAPTSPGKKVFFSMRNEIGGLVGFKRIRKMTAVS